MPEVGGPWIGTGRVQVNGKSIQTPDHWVDMQRDKVTLDGKPIRSAEKIYLLLYKPKGYLTTHKAPKDPEGRRTVYDLMEGTESWIFPVGRLDPDSSGLLIMTNDTGSPSVVGSQAVVLLSGCAT